MGLSTASEVAWRRDEFAADTAETLIPIVFCIDAENDEHNPGRYARLPWRTLEVCFQQLGRYRDVLADATGRYAQFTWAVRADAQLADIYGDSAWGLREYQSEWHALAALGDDIGLHPHPQRWHEIEQFWSGGQDDDPDWPAQVLRIAHRDFCHTLGWAPSTLRFGNRYMSQSLAATAAALGFRYDLTLEPGYAGRSGLESWHRLPGRCDDYFSIPRVPYRSSRKDFRNQHILCSPNTAYASDASASTLWHVPMSTAPIADMFAAANDEPVASASNRAAVAPMSVGPAYVAVQPSTHRYEVLHLCMATPHFQSGVNHVLTELAQPYLALVIRCDMITLPVVWANLEWLRTHPLARRFWFTNSSEVVTCLGSRGSM
jgi:hypothetical protein